jgi:L-iditol 2-dehydrogenase
LSFEEGSLLEPLSVALAGIDRSNLRLGDALAICGAGPIGLVTLLAAHAAGAGPIVITDLDPNRLARAKELVPRVRTVQVSKGDDPQALGAKMVDALGMEAKLVLECTGAESSIHAGIYVSELSADLYVRTNLR